MLASVSGKLPSLRVGLRSDASRSKPGAASNGRGRLIGWFVAGHRSKPEMLKRTYSGRSPAIVVRYISRRNPS